jgi:hypothetical protein
MSSSNDEKMNLGGSSSGQAANEFRSTGTATAGLNESGKQAGPGQTTHEAQAGTVTSGNAGTADTKNNSSS